MSYKRRDKEFDERLRKLHEDIEKNTTAFAKRGHPDIQDAISTHMQRRYTGTKRNWYRITKYFLATVTGGIFAMFSVFHAIANIHRAEFVLWAAAVFVFLDTTIDDGLLKLLREIASDE